MTLLKTLTIISIAGIMGATTLSAEPFMMGEHCKSEKGMYKGHKGKHDNMRQIMQELNLTDEQKATLKADRQAMRETMKAKRATMKGASRGMSQFVTVNGVDRNAMIAQATERATNMANMRADRIEKLMSILTPEQKIKFVELLQAQKK